METLYFVCTCGQVCATVYMWRSSCPSDFHVSVVAHHRTIFRVSSLLPPYGIWELNSHHQTWRQAPLPTEPSGGHKYVCLHVCACTCGCEGLRGQLIGASSHFPSLLRQGLSSVGLYHITQASWPLSFQPILHFILCLWVFCLHVCPCTMCISSAKEARRGCGIPWNWSYIWLQATMGCWYAHLGSLEKPVVLLTSPVPSRKFSPSPVSW